MKQLIAIAFVLVFLTVPAMSQQVTQQNNSTCTAKFAQALSIRGVHLGMSADEVLDMFPDAQNNNINRNNLKEAKTLPYFGKASLFIKPGGSVSREKLAGIANISLVIFDNQVVRYSVSYEDQPDGVRWDNEDQWISKLSETLKLPAISEWTATDTPGSKVLNCEGVKIIAGVNGYGSILVINDAWILDQIKARRKVYEDQKRREFKP